MSSKHLQRLQAEYTRLLEHKRVHVLDIPDDFRYMDPELVSMLDSITKMMSAHRISTGPTDLRAFGLVPAERALKPARRRQMASAVGLRHWLRLQTKRRLVTVDPVEE